MRLEQSGGSMLDATIYGYSAANQRTQQVFTAGNYVNYTYDKMGQLQSATGKESGGSTNRLQEQLGYAYDGAGNLNYRTNNALVQTYGVNSLNELSAVTRSGTFTVAGTTTSPATNVTVNGQTAALYGDATFAAAGFTPANGTNTFTAIAKDSYGRVDTNVSVSYLPSPVSYTYDSNGNLTSDGSRCFAYDDENQLTSVWVTNAWRSDFVYDGTMRRRIRTEYTWNGSTWLTNLVVRYVYDGNLVIQERDGNNLPQATYTRGSDLSGSLAGAGGIGGLLARSSNPQLLSSSSAGSAHAYYHADANGNITCLINANQALVAKYLYDPYGNILSQSGSLAGVNLYLFSSTEFHANSGLLYNLYRFYDPNLQRWLNQDPLGSVASIEDVYKTFGLLQPPRRIGSPSTVLPFEKWIGPNLCDYVGNDPINAIDPLGLWTFQFGFTFALNWGWGNFFVSAGITGDTQGNINTYTTGGAGAALEAAIQAGVTVQVSNGKCNNDLSGMFGYGSLGGGFGPDGSLDAFWGNSPDGKVIGVGGTFGVGAGAGANGGISGTTIRPLWPWKKG